MLMTATDVWLACCYTMVQKVDEIINVAVVEGPTHIMHIYDHMLMHAGLAKVDLAVICAPHPQRIRTCSTLKSNLNVYDGTVWIGEAKHVSTMTAPSVALDIVADIVARLRLEVHT
jgi:hypothetical protein